MGRLEIADDRHVRAIYRESHALWGAALSPVDYAGLWDDINRTPWARKHARFLVWLGPGGELLSSMKVYRPLVRIDGETSRAAVLGAIFTPRAHRRRGHARAMLAEALRRSSGSGERVALLFSDIGEDYYGHLGFRSLPAEEHWSTLPGSDRASQRGWMLRPMQVADQASIRAAHRDTTASRRIAVVRDEEHWHYLWVRSASFFRRLGDPRVRQRCRVAVSGGRFVGYLVTVEGRGEWHVRECGALGGDPRVLARILRLGACRARRSGLRRFYGWLPREVADGLVDWRLRSRPRRRAVPMILPHDRTIDVQSLAGSTAAYIPFHDQF